MTTIYVNLDRQTALETNMPNALELLGEKELQLNESHAQYRALWDVLRQVTEGSISLDRVTVGMEPDGRLSWSVSPLPSDELSIVIPITTEPESES